MRHLGIALADQVRDTHRVEDPRVCRLGCGHIGITVEVDQAQVRLVAQQSGDDAERNRAIPPDHQRNEVTLHGRRHPIRNLARNRDHG